MELRMMAWKYLPLLLRSFIGCITDVWLVVDTLGITYESETTWYDFMQLAASQFFT